MCAKYLAAAVLTESCRAFLKPVHVLVWIAFYTSFQCPLGIVARRANLRCAVLLLPVRFKTGKKQRTAVSSLVVHKRLWTTNELTAVVFISVGVSLSGTALLIISSPPIILYRHWRENYIPCGPQQEKRRENEGIDHRRPSTSSNVLPILGACQM